MLKKKRIKNSFKISLIFLYIILYYYFILKKNEVNDLNNMQNFINININHKLLNPIQKLHKFHYPKISIIISVYNGEPYLKTALRSIQNQNFNNIEIIIVDDCSKDNSVNEIKELMIEDPRIIFLQNIENKGALYTKIKGIMNAKGKYVLTLDVDDLYTSEYSFSILYYEAERNNLDLLGFSIIMSDKNILKKTLSFHHYWETEVLFQPNVSYMMYSFDKNNKPRRVGDVISAYFMKRNILFDSIKEIDNEIMNKKIIHHDDLFIFFLLSRKAKNLKQIKNPFYLVLLNPDYNQTLLELHKIEKEKLHLEYGCLSYLYYVKFLLIKTEDTYLDKKIASFELENWYLKNQCRNDSYSKEEGIQICNLYLQNKYIDENIKNEIKIFLDENQKA